MEVRLRRTCFRRGDRDCFAGTNLYPLVTFNGTNGAGSGAPPIQGLDGYLYGTVGGGGANSSGIMFKMTPTGKLTTLYTFCSQTDCLDGNEPGGLLLGTDGNFYAPTVNGGNYNDGTVFTASNTGSLTTLFSFDSTNGAHAYAPMVEGSNGNFYGSTANGGNLAECFDSGCGTIFEITPSGEQTALYDFCSVSAAAPTVPWLSAPWREAWTATFTG